MALTQDVVLSFLMGRGGKVKNTELLSAFTTHINCSEPEERRRNRDQFKTFINNVAVVKRVDDVKYVVVKKKYQELIIAGKSSIASSSSSSSSSTTQQTCISKCESLLKTGADVLNNNSWFCTSPPVCYIHECKDFVTKQQFQIGPECDAVSPPPVTTSSQEESLTAQVLNVANNTRNCKIGAVFAVVAIKSPPCSQSEQIILNHGIHASYHHQGLEIPLQQEVNTLEAGQTSSFLNHKSDLNISPRTKRRQMMVPSLPALKRESKVDFRGKDRRAVRLEPKEHEWLVKSATGRWSQLYSLLLKDVQLAQTRSFISGFTALHWAAKHGNSKMVRKILDVGKKVDVNIKSHDGYTPLHVAAIHNHESVLNLLVRQYGANCNIRDNSGKKAYQYLRKDLSAEVRELLGDPALSRQDTKHVYSEDQHFLPKNLNTFSKLFQASVEHKKKSRHRTSFRLISIEQKESRKDCTLGHKH